MYIIPPIHRLVSSALELHDKVCLKFSWIVDNLGQIFELLHCKRERIVVKLQIVYIECVRKYIYRYQSEFEVMCVTVLHVHL